jgi:hypothetical protein
MSSNSTRALNRFSARRKFSSRWKRRRSIHPTLRSSVASTASGRPSHSRPSAGRRGAAVEYGKAQCCKTLDMSTTRHSSLGGEFGKRNRSCLGRELRSRRRSRCEHPGQDRGCLADNGRCAMKDRTLTGSAACRAVKSGAPFSARATIALRRGKETAGCTAAHWTVRPMFGLDSSSSSKHKMACSDATLALGRGYPSLGRAQSSPRKTRRVSRHFSRRP